MATGAEHFIRQLTIKMDEAARQWNSTKDPSFRDQWYKLLRQVPPASALSHKKTSGKAPSSQ
jgi:hypothetical protein